MTAAAFLSRQLLVSRPLVLLHVGTALGKPQRDLSPLMQLQALRLAPAWFCLQVTGAEMKPDSASLSGPSFPRQAYEDVELRGGFHRRISFPWNSGPMFGAYVGFLSSPLVLIERSLWRWDRKPPSPSSLMPPTFSSVVRSLGEASSDGFWPFAFALPAPRHLAYPGSSTLFVPGSFPTSGFLCRNSLPKTWISPCLTITDPGNAPLL